jgi:hypothetical protein
MFQNMPAAEKAIQPQREELRSTLGGTKPEANE